VHRNWLADDRSVNTAQSFATVFACYQVSVIEIGRSVIHIVIYPSICVVPFPFVYIIGSFICNTGVKGYSSTQANIILTSSDGNGRNARRILSKQVTSPNKKYNHTKLQHKGQAIAGKTSQVR
jgi:hypothetical protein